MIKIGFKFRQIEKPAKTINYKEERLKDLKKYAVSIWIDLWKIPYMNAWFRTENWSLSEYVLWDEWQAIWLCQCNKIYRTCAKIWDYEGQKKQCIDWFQGYTDESTRQTILKDIRKSHNPRSITYEMNIKKLLTN